MKFYKGVDAAQFDGTQEDLLRIEKELNLPEGSLHIAVDDSPHTHVIDGSIELVKDDWVVVEEGEICLHKPDVFAETYEPAEPVDWSTKPQPLVDFRVGVEKLYCAGCGKPKILCLNDTTVCNHG